MRPARDGAGDGTGGGMAYDSGALYVSLGYQIVGVIPDYAMDVDGSKRDPTTIMYKRL